MAFDASPPFEPEDPPSGTPYAPARPRKAPVACAVMVLVPALVGTAVFLIAEPGAFYDTRPDLLSLLRGLAVLKASLVLAAAAAVMVRLCAPITQGRLLAYAAPLASAGAGVGLLGAPTHLVVGAVALHAGLAGTLIQLFRDPGMLDAMTRLSRARHPVYLGPQAGRP